MTGNPVAVWTLDPLDDPRWADLVAAHPGASVFHTPGWLGALRRTYGYRPVVFTTSPPGEALTGGWPFCEVRGPLGRRLVSLPFSDHCDPLVGGPADLEDLATHVAGRRARRVESRPRTVLLPETMAACAEYVLHTLDLSSSLERVFGGFHPSCMQRVVRRAERDGLEYRRGRGDHYLPEFYRLLTMTRRRHGVPPPSMRWFRNLAACLGDDAVSVHVAARGGEAVAAILTLRFRSTLVYKYGGSDARLHRLGGMPFLFWRAIEWAKGEGCDTLDLGRSDLAQPGLIAFKDHLGASRSTMTYCRYPAPRSVPSGAGWPSRLAHGVFARLPDPALVLAGRILYRHFG